MTDTPRLDQSLAKATREYLTLDQREKTAAKKKKAKRDKFFELATKKIAKRRLSRQTIEIDDLDTDIEEYVSRFFPAWNIEGFVEVEEDDRHYFSVSLVENPAISKFTFVNHDLEMVFGRTFEMRGAGFDTERFAEEQPDLAERCLDLHTKYSFHAGSWKFNEDGIPVPNDATDDGAPEDRYVLNEDLANEIQVNEPETVVIFQQYANPGELNIKIVSPRKAKEEELSE